MVKVDVKLKAVCANGKVVTVCVDKNVKQEKIQYVCVDDVIQFNFVPSLGEAYSKAHSLIKSFGGEVPEPQKIQAASYYGKLGAENAVQVKHDGLPSGYITDKELFEWALVGVQSRIKELHIENVKIAGERMGQPNPPIECDPMVTNKGAISLLSAKKVYLREVLDGLG